MAGRSILDTVMGVPKPDPKRNETLEALETAYAGYIDALRAALRDETLSTRRIAPVIDVSYPTVYRWRKTMRDAGLM